MQEDRPDPPGGQPAPLTDTQLDDLLGERSSRTRVVLGTSAIGVAEGPTSLPVRGTVRYDPGTARRAARSVAPEGVVEDRAAPTPVPWLFAEYVLFLQGLA